MKVFQQLRRSPTLRKTKEYECSKFVTESIDEVQSSISSPCSPRKTSNSNHSLAGIDSATSTSCSTISEHSSYRTQDLVEILPPQLETVDAEQPLRPMKPKRNVNFPEELVTLTVESPPLDEDDLAAYFYNIEDYTETKLECVAIAQMYVECTRSGCPYAEDVFGAVRGLEEILQSDARLNRFNHRKHVLDEQTRLQKERSGTKARADDLRFVELLAEISSKHSRTLCEQALLRGYEDAVVAGFASTPKPVLTAPVDPVLGPTATSTTTSSSKAAKQTKNRSLRRWFK